MNLPMNVIEEVIKEIQRLKPDMLRFLGKIVNMDSPTEDKALTDKVGDVLAAKADSIGLVSIRDKQPDFADNRIARTPHKVPQRQFPRILFVGHFDTVYAAGTVAERPFTISGDRAMGPGVLDMKGGLTVGIFALQVIRKVLGELPFHATFIFNSDEEIGSPASRKIILEEVSRHDLALVLEPGVDQASITIGRKGVGIFNIDVDGIEAHAGRDPEQGANAIVEAAHKIIAIQALQNLEAGTSVTPGVVRGGTKPYVVPGSCGLSVDVRVRTAAEEARIAKGLEEIAHRTWITRTHSRLSGSFHRPPMEATATTLRYVELLEASGAKLGISIGRALSGGASDGNLTANAGLPTIDGLGVCGGRAHSADEFIITETLSERCRLLAVFLLALAGDPGYLPRKDA